MNRILAYLVTWAIFLLVFLLVLEGGLRLMGKGPKTTINEFHPKMGWVKTPNTTARHHTSEFDITYKINALGLRDDANLSKDKPIAGEKRILCLGDSFTLGYTVDRENLFADLLESKLNREGRHDHIEVINAGTEGYSSDQELLWLKEEGLAYHPDIVVMNFYQNDVYWNSQDHYLRFPKPRFAAEGAAEAPEKAELEDPGKQGWFTGSTAVGKLFAESEAGPELYETPDGTLVPREWAVLLKGEPDFIRDAWTHTAAVLKGFKQTCEARKIKPLLALIPTKAQIYDRFKEEQGKQLGLREGTWDPNIPFDRVLEICRAIDLEVLDPRSAFSGKADQGVELYFTQDRHFTPEGNEAYAQTLYYRLVDDAFLGKAPKASALAAKSVSKSDGVASKGLPAWLIVVLSLWVVLG
ncbi:MAG: SGNH/GDSL hydrolase family protein, partial [Planctomycetes bacterium]|nr:SGNH/GDSL hydrolase family protein [Planctomycetota bacterium]